MHGGASIPARPREPRQRGDKLEPARAVAYVGCGSSCAAGAVSGVQALRRVAAPGATVRFTRSLQGPGESGQGRHGGSWVPDSSRAAADCCMRPRAGLPGQGEWVFSRADGSHFHPDEPTELIMTVGLSSSPTARQRRPDADMRIGLADRVDHGCRALSSPPTARQRRCDADLGMPVLAAEVRLLERYAQAHGQPVPADLGDYQHVLRELHDQDRADAR